MKKKNYQKRIRQLFLGQDFAQHLGSTPLEIDMMLSWADEVLDPIDGTGEFYALCKLAFDPNKGNHLAREAIVRMIKRKFKEYHRRPTRLL